MTTTIKAFEKDIQRQYDVERDAYIYFNEDLLKNNILIEESTNITETEEVLTLISIKHFNDIDAIHYTIYEGDLLSPIQIYRIINDIHTFYSENSLTEFLEIVDNLSIGSMSASTQSKKESKLKIMDWIKSSFTKIQ